MPARLNSGCWAPKKGAAPYRKAQNGLINCHRKQYSLNTTCPRLCPDGACFEEHTYTNDAGSRMYNCSFQPGYIADSEPSNAATVSWPGWRRGLEAVGDRITLGQGDLTILPCEATRLNRARSREGA